jgi:hypothetical protein
VTGEGGKRDIHTTIVFAVVVDHEHDFPLEDIVVDQATAYAGNVFVGLHLFKLPPKQASSCGRGRHLLAGQSTDREAVGGRRKGESRMGSTTKVQRRC